MINSKASIAIAGVLLCSAATPALAQSEVSYDRLVNPEPENWLHTCGNYQGWRYTSLDEINVDNVGDLRLAFAVPLSLRGGLSGNLQSAPLVDDGFVYTVDMANGVVKIDVSAGNSGTQLWRVETTPAENQGRNQGPAFWGDNIYAVTPVGTLIAISRDSGDVVWEESYTIPGESMNASPVPLEDRIIIGNNRGDSGTRGWVAAVDPNDGTEYWRFYVVPGPGEPGHETWPQDTDAWETGGGGIWVAPTYDPSSDLVFLGTGNPAPFWDAEFRPGDNLYTSSVVALNPDDGSINWYFQYMPNDSRDIDEISPHMLYDVEVDGEMRQLFGHFSRSGYFFTFDRIAGEFLFAGAQQSNINWTAGIDPKSGKPVEYDPNVEFQRYLINPERGEETVEICGGWRITGNWPPAYDPERQRVYNTSPNDSCWTGVRVDWDWTQSAEERFGRQSLGGPLAGVNTNHRITATDAVTAELLMETPLVTEAKSGVLTTAGGLVFTGDNMGVLQAYDSDTLEQLWSFNVGGQMVSPPFAYAVDGRQYIAIQTGGAPLANAEFFFGRVVGPNSSYLWVFSL